MAEKEVAGIRDPGVARLQTGVWTRVWPVHGTEEGEDSRLWLGGRKSLGIIRRHTEVLLKTGTNRGEQVYQAGRVRAHRIPELGPRGLEKAQVLVPAPGLAEVWA